MRKSSVILLIAFAMQACAAPAGTREAANTTAAGRTRDAKAVLRLEYAYSGQGLTGTTSSLEDLTRGAFVDSYDIGGQNGALGYDGVRAWEREPSGTVTPQAGGDVVRLAVTESYIDRNLWWRTDHGGARVVDEGRRRSDGVAYDVLLVTPPGGAPVTAWFDANTHLLARTVEETGLQTTTTEYLDYAAFDGVSIARELVIDDGSGNLQTKTLTAAKLLGTLPAAAFMMPKVKLSDARILGGAHQATVPFRLINNHIYAEASVNGSKPMLFVLDSGGHSILTPDTARALGLRPKGSQTMTGTGSGFAESGLATVRSIRIGGAEILDQPVTVLDFVNPAAEGVKEQGMVGYEFFARFVTRFDYANHTVTFADRRYFDPKGAGTPVPFVLFHQLPEVRGTYGGIAGYFGIDTGSRWGLSITRPFAMAHALPPPGTKRVLAAVSWGVGGLSRGFVFRGSTLQLGSVGISSPLAEVSTDEGGSGASDSFPNNIGNDIFERFIMTLDYGRMTLYLRPVGNPGGAHGTFDRSGMWINEATRGFRIVDISKPGPAADAGLEAGDLILAIDGRPAGAIPLDEIRLRLRDDPPGTVVKLKIQRGRSHRDVQLRLRDLI